MLDCFFQLVGTMHAERTFQACQNPSHPGKVIGITSKHHTCIRSLQNCDLRRDVLLCLFERCFQKHLYRPAPGDAAERTQHRIQNIELRRALECLVKDFSFYNPV